ncbi:MAG: hypothetical protein ABIJ16_12020 [Bacteroidota bacterium]
MSVAEIILMLILAAVKFAFSVPVIIFKYKLPFFESVLLVACGGILGVLFFAFITTLLVRLWNYLLGESKFESDIIWFFNKIFRFRKKGQKKKVFTWRNKMIAKTKTHYGLIGLALLTPSLLSIPIGTFITLRYYPDLKKTVIYLIASVILWSFVFCLIFFFFVDHNSGV